MRRDRSQRIGLIASVVGHLILLLWAIFGGFFFSYDNLPATQSQEVSLMSSKDFAALQARAPKAAKESTPTPSKPKSKPKPPPKPKPAPAPEEQPTEQTDVATPAPEEKPSPTTTDNLVDVPQTDKTNPKPKSAPIVSPTPTEKPQPDAKQAEQTQEQVDQAQSEAQPTPEKPKEATAPQEAGQVLESEANKDDKEIGSAPKRSPMPKAKPEKKPEPQPAPDTADTSAPDATDTPDQTDTQATDDAAVNDALAEALSGAASDTPEAGTGVAESGPPMTDGEKDALRVSVKECWNTGSLSTDALHTSVTVLINFAQDGKPSNIELLGSEGGDDAAVRQSFEAARRAILRCARTGYPLPADKYDSWKETEITFDPSQMALR